jgi:hypothetical protein
MGYPAIEDNFSDFSKDAEVLRSRLYDDSDYDPAIVGTTVNSSGKRVIVYDDEKLLDLVEERLVREREESGEDPIEDSELRSTADDFLHYKLSDYLYYARPHAAVIVFEPREKISHYEEEGFEIYESGGQLVVGELKEE